MKPCIMVRMARTKRRIDMERLKALVKAKLTVAEIAKVLDAPYMTVWRRVKEVKNGARR